MICVLRLLTCHKVVKCLQISRIEINENSGEITFKRSVFIVLVFTLGVIFHFILTSPKEIQTSSILALDGDLVKGERVFMLRGVAAVMSAPIARRTFY